MLSFHVYINLRRRTNSVGIFSIYTSSVHQFACGTDVCVSEGTKDVGASSVGIFGGVHLDLVVEIIVGLVLIATSNAGRVLPDNFTSVLITPHVST